MARLRLLALLLIIAALCSCAQNNSYEQVAPAREVEQAPKPRACLNLNTATVEELMRLPGIGKARAQKIIEHRERHGSFRRPEELIIIDGFSERRYRALAHLVCAE